MSHYLVVAHQTAVSRELVAALRLKMEEDSDACFTLLVPATPVQHLLTWSEGETQDVAARKATEALEELRREGLPVGLAKVGAASPVVAIGDELRLHPTTYTGIVLATHPAPLSRWLKVDVLNRASRLTTLPITHVTALPQEGDLGLAPTPSLCEHIEVEHHWTDDEFGGRYPLYRCIKCGELLDHDVRNRVGAWRL
jgi:hypothetical protein